MATEVTTDIDENIFLSPNITDSSGTNDSFDSSYSFTANQTYDLKLYYAEHQEDLFFLFLTAFRILYSKYQFSTEPLFCKTILSKADSSSSKYRQLFATRIDFPGIESTKSTIKMVFNESKEIFRKYHNIEDQLTVFDSYEFTLLALNTDSEQIELECTIQIDHGINFTFKTPISSQLANVASNSVHHFLNILHAIQQSSNQIVAAIPILDTVEQDFLLQWSEGKFSPSISQPACLHQFFERTCTTYPDHPAVFCNGHGFSYKDIDNKANQLARHLQLKGIGKGDYCGILIPRTEAMYVAMLAILKLGAAYIPLDVSTPKERLHFILNDSGSKGLISHTKFNDKYNDHPCTKIILDDEASIISIFDTTPPVHKSQIPSPDDIAYIIYTSGTTGTPKGVKIPHTAICNLVRAEAGIFNITPVDKVFQGFSISFDASLEEIWLAFYTGAQLFVGTEETVQSGSQMATYIDENQITVFSTVPTLLATLTEDLPSVTTLILGGEACSMELVNKWSTGKRRMVNTYGPTESTVIATYSDCKSNTKVTIGKPVVNYCTYILDTNQQMIPIGIAG